MGRQGGVRSVKDGSLIKRDSEIITTDMSMVQKGGIKHFILKEIHEQSHVAQELLHLLNNTTDVQTILDGVNSARHIYFIGCGTSYHACLADAVYFSQLAGKSVTPVLATQFLPQYLPSISQEDAGIFVSQSGETKYVLNALQAAAQVGMTCFGMANVIGSTLTRKTYAWLPLGCGYEISVPTTKTFTKQVITFLYLATRLGGQDIKQLDLLPEIMRQTIELSDSQVVSLVPLINPWTDLYCLGFGTTYPMALEGALKIKEITYTHCEGMLSTEFKHGPLSAVTKDFPIILQPDRRMCH